MLGNKFCKYNWLITGGAGSIGQAITRELLKTDGVNAIRILDNNEYSMVNMKADITDSRLRFIIGDVRDSESLLSAMDGVEFVIHAAALKHVPICQYNPVEAVKTNIDGTRNVINCARVKEVNKVLAISSDKAVYPVNMYGATKLAAEQLIVNAAFYSKTRLPD